MLKQCGTIAGLTRAYVDSSCQWRQFVSVLGLSICNTSCGNRWLRYNLNPDTTALQLIGICYYSSAVPVSGMYDMPAEKVSGSRNDCQDRFCLRSCSASIARHNLMIFNIAGSSCCLYQGSLSCYFCRLEYFIRNCTIAAECIHLYHAVRK